jgi:hypothetical protein
LNVKKIPHSKKSLNDINNWPPGEFIMIDQNDEWRRRGSPRDIAPFVGLGVVVANDGIKRIAVLWGSNCRDTYVEYSVDRLNPATMYHVG